MKKIYFKIAMVLLCALFLTACSTDHEIDGTKDTVKSIVNGNTIVLTKGLKVQLLGVAPGHETTTVFMTNNNIVGKKVKLLVDKKAKKKTYQKSTSTVKAYVIVNPDMPDKYCLNGQILRQCAKSDHTIFSSVGVTDSLEVWRALLSGCNHSEKIPDIALYMKQRTFLIVTPEGIGTGFFINDKGLAITNYHVLPKKYEGSAKVYMYGDNPDDSKIYTEKERNIDKILAWSSDDELDITIFAVDLLNGEEVPYFHLAKEQAPVGSHVQTLGNPGINGTDIFFTAKYTDGTIGSYLTGDQSIEIGHPGNLVTYNVDTNPGNSGGAVVLDNGLVIAVHTLGIKAMQGFNAGLNILQVREMLDGINADYECK